MPLEFYLMPNSMTSDPDDYMAVSSNSETYSIEDVYEHMTREGSSITKAEALASFEEVTQGIINLVEDGNSVVTPLVNISSSVAGVFDGEDDSFNPSRHRVGISISAGKRMAKASADITPHKVAVRERHPAPVHFYDHTSETEDDIITAGGGARISGSLLKFDEADNSEGIFFVNKSDGSEKRVDSTLLRNKPGELIFILPALSAGTYRLEVRSTMNTNSMRSGTLSDELTVN